MNENKSKSKRIAFYVICGAMLGLPYLYKLIRLIPQLIETVPDFLEVFTCIGYTALVAVSLAVAYKFNETLWVRIIGVYGVVSLVITVLSMIFGVLESFEVFTVLFTLVSAPYVGINSPVSIMVLMMLITAASYITLSRMPIKKQ